MGDNGSGKSGFLEAWLFALYGKVRTPSLSGFIREGQDSGSVSATFDTATGDELSVHRKLKRNASGNVVSAAELRRGGEIIASGDGVTKTVESLIGIGSDIFMLTTFFGMHESESILSAKPSDRLDTLQSIANVSVYQDFAKAARSGAAAASSSALESKGKIATLEALCGTSAAIDLKAKKAEYNKAQERVETQRSLLANLRMEHDKIKSDLQSLVHSKRRVAELTSQIADLKASLAQYTETVGSKALQLARLRKELQECESRFSKAVYTKLQLSIDAASGAKKEAEVALNLRQLASSEHKHESDETCPLCHHDLTSEDLELWLQEIPQLQSRVKELQGELAKLNKAKEAMQQAEQAATEKRHQLSLAETTLETATSRKAEIDLQLRQAEQTLSQITLQHKKTQARVANREGIASEVYEAETLLDDLNRTAQSLHVDIETKRRQIAEAAQHKKNLKQATEDFATANCDRMAYEALQSAFGRYGIPLSLLAELQSQLSEEATAIYGEFELGGQICVVDVEDRGRPGIDFIVRKLSGSERTYAALSDGQRAIMYFSIRLALARILSQVYPNVPDFLILDELTAKLSENNRDQLVSVITRILEKEYKQILLTSHHNLRNIFDHTLQVTIRDEVTSATVLE